MSNTKGDLCLFCTSSKSLAVLVTGWGWVKNDCDGVLSLIGVGALKKSGDLIVLIYDLKAFCGWTGGFEVDGIAVLIIVEG